MKFPFLCPAAHWCSPLLPWTMPWNMCARRVWSLPHLDGQEMEKRWIYQLKESGRLQVEKFPPGPGFSAPAWARRDPVGTSPLHGPEAAMSCLMLVGSGLPGPPFLKASAAGHHSTLGRAEGRTRHLQGCKMPENWKFSHCAVNGAE